MARYIDPINIELFPLACVGKSTYGENFNIVTLSKDLSHGWYIDIESKSMVELKGTDGRLSGVGDHAEFKLRADVTVEYDLDIEKYRSTTQLSVNGRQVQIGESDFDKFVGVVCDSYGQSELYRIYLGL